MIDIFSLKKVVQYLLLIILFTPLLFTPFTLYPSYYGRTAIFQFLVGIAFLLYLILLIKRGVAKPKLDLLFWSIFIFLSIRVLTGFFGLNPEKSFFGTEARMGGNFTWLHFFIFFFLLTQFLKDKKDWLRLIKVSICVSLLAALTGILQRFGIVPLDWWAQSRRIYGVIGNSIPFASYILFNIWFAVLVLWISLFDIFKNWQTKKIIFEKIKIILSTIFWGVVLTIHIIALFWSCTRGAIYVFLISIPLAIFLFGVFSKKRFVRLGVLLLILFILVSTLFIFINREKDFIISNSFFSKIVSAPSILAQDTTMNTRLLNWEIALQGWLDSPRSFLIGYGTENYDRVFDKFYNKEFLKYSFYETVGDRPHNIFLEIVNASGIFGLLSYLSIFFIVFYILILETKKGALSKISAIILSLAFLTYLGQNFFEFDSTNVLILFFLSLAFVSSIKKPLREVPYRTSTVPCVIIFIVVSLGIYFGTFQPLKASYYTLKITDYEYENQEEWGLIAIKALEANSIFHDEIRIHIANGSFRLAAYGLFNISRINIEALKISHQKLLDSVSKHPETYAYKHRFAQVEAMMGEYVDKKYFDDAEKTFRELDAKNPNRQAIGLAWGQMKLIRGDISGAVEILQKIVNKNPESDEMHWYLGLALLEAGEKERGIEELERSYYSGNYILEKFINVELLIGLWSEKGDYEKMISFYEKRIETDKETLKIKGILPKLLTVWLTRLAATYAEIGEIDKAIEMTQEAVSYDPALAEEAEKFIKSLQRK